MAPADPPDWGHERARPGGAGPGRPGGVGKGPGLRGGSFTVKGDAPATFSLRGVKFVSDAAVDGTGTYRFSNGAVRGQLSVKAPGGAPVSVRVAWTQRSTVATAQVGGAKLSLPAP